MSVNQVINICVKKKMNIVIIIFLISGQTNSPTVYCYNLNSITTGKMPFLTSEQSDFLKLKEIIS